jgi:hypothetical protein
MQHRILPRVPVGNPRRIWRQDNFILSTFSARGRDMRSVIENCTEAGFNLLEMGWASHEQAEEALRLCEEYAIDLLYQDFSVFGGMQERNADRRVTRETVKQVTDHLRPYRHATGVYVWDEPYVEYQCLEARRQTDLFQSENPALLPFTVAIPSYNTLYTWENGLFEDYLRWYVRDIDPPVLSLDYYPVVQGLGYSDEDQFDSSRMWCDLGLMRKLGREADIPLWFYYQGVNLHRYPHFEFPMVECMMNAAVLYGVKGLQQFTAVGNVIDENGDKGPFFEETKKVHAKFRKLGNTLMALENRFVFHSAEIAEKCPLYAPFADSTSNSAVLADTPLPPRVSAGEFGDAFGNVYLYVLNRDIDGAYNRSRDTEHPAEGEDADMRSVTLPLKEKFRIYPVRSDNGRQAEPWEDDALRTLLSPGCAALFRIQPVSEPAFTLEYRLEK